MGKRYFGIVGVIESISDLIPSGSESKNNSDC
jgi:hypothetical protein